MIGQGRPTESPRAAIARALRAIFWLRGAFLALALVLTPVHVVAAEATLKLRIAWGGGAEHVWQGKIRIADGTFTDLSALGIEADEPGAIWLQSGDEICIQHPSPRSYDGIDVTVRGDSSSELLIEIASDSTAEPRRVSLSLSELIDGVHNESLDDTGNRLSVARAPGDRLRIDFDRPHLVFSPGESFAFRVKPHLIGASTEGAHLYASIAAAPGGQRMWADDYATGAEGTATEIVLPVPRQEGVYNLTVAVAPASRIKQRLRLPQKPLVERTIQFVVVSPEPTPQSGEAPTSKVLEINPVNSRWWERLTALPTIPGFRKGPLGNGDAASWNHPTLGPMMQLGPGGTAPNISWEAYPLPLSQPGQVHVLEIEYPTDVPQAMGISLIEPNSAGTVVPIGLDSGVYVSDEEAEESPRLAKHRIVFWPKTKTPLVLITNRRQGARAVYGKIAVYSAPQSQLALLTLGKFDSGATLPAAFPDDDRGERLWAGYMDRPLVAENFGAPESFDEQSRRSLDDWNTFHQGGTRLVKYLRHIGYNGLMLSVLADGSTIYPSKLLSPTPRYDTGTFFATGQDPVRKDSLELLFRLFDRERLKLIPALQFATPLPELEAIRRAEAPESSGIEWVGADGRPWPRTGAPLGLAPYYNLLDPRVQSAMLKVVREAVARYAAHEAFGGVALQLSPDGYAQLPGEVWGFDDATIARFERETGVQVPGGTGPGRFDARAKYLAGTARDTWLEWRAQVVAEFHRSLQQEISTAHPGARLYLAGGTMLEGEFVQSRFLPGLPRKAKIDEAFSEVGVSLQHERHATGITVLRPQLLRPSDTLPNGAMESEQYLSRDLDVLFASAGQRGTLFYHEPQKARLANFDIQSPFGPSNTFAWLVSQMSPSGDRNRRRFAHSLAVADSSEMFDGGWLLPLGQEDSLRGLLSIYRQLPDAPFQTFEGDAQPLTIRTLSHEGQTYLYLVNDSPWQVTTTLHLDVSASGQLEKLGESPGADSLLRSAAGATWLVTLKPFDLAAAKLSSPNVRVIEAELSLPDNVPGRLEQRISDLVARVRTLAHPMLENPSFETPLVNQQIAGWSARVPYGGRVAIDSRWKHSGSRSVLLSTNGPPVSIATVPLERPSVGRLAVEVLLRTSDNRQSPSLKIAVEGETTGDAFSEQGIIRRVGASARQPGEWVRYKFPVAEIPDDVVNLRVRFELLEPGEVWVDDVQVRPFSGDELMELSKINSLARLNLDKGQYADCERVLEGYWPQFLLAKVPLTTASTPVAQRPKPVESPPVEPEKSPSMFETMKSYLPPIFR